MADGLPFKFDATAFHKGIAARQKRMPRAAMWAVREAGRVTKRAAAKQAPVMRGGYSLAQMRRDSKFRSSGGIGPTVGSGLADKPVAGLLRASIKPSKHVKVSPGGGATLKVGPRGERVHLYAQKAEARTGYMAAGEQAAKTALPAIAERAFNRVWKER